VVLDAQHRCAPADQRLVMGSQATLTASSAPTPAERLLLVAPISLSM